MILVFEDLNDEDLLKDLGNTLRYGIAKIMNIKRTISMKSILSNKRSKAILVIGLIAIGIGAIAKKVINYPSGGCIKGNQELTINKVKNYLFKE